MSNPADSNPDQIREFAEATAFERYVLDLLVPAPSAIPRGSTTLRAGGHKDATVFADTLEIGRGSKKIAALQTQLLPVTPSVRLGRCWTYSRNWPSTAPRQL